jgi:uncharacterized ion transporter superfamily protein YfcC
MMIIFVGMIALLVHVHIRLVNHRYTNDYIIFTVDIVIFLLLFNGGLNQILKTGWLGVGIKFLSRATFRHVNTLITH